jgi:hypothetical protein
MTTDIMELERRAGTQSSGKASAHTCTGLSVHQRYTEPRPSHAIVFAGAGIIRSRRIAKANLSRGRRGSDGLCHVDADATQCIGDRSEGMGLIALASEAGEMQTHASRSRRETKDDGPR